MRILQVSKFLRHVGGVETYIQWLGEELADAGHEVGFFGMDLPADRPPLYAGGQFAAYTPERDFHGSLKRKAIDGAASIYSPAVGRRLREAIADFEPNLVHFHGTCYQLTPSVFRAVQERHVPSMITAHEYKLTCANQRLWDDRAGAECYACVGASSAAKSANILKRSCVKGSRPASAVAAVEQLVADRVLRPHPGLIHAPSKFMQDTLVADGYAPGAVVYKDLPWEDWRPSASHAERNTLQFIGRLSVEKGVAQLLAAWKLVESARQDIFLRVSGDGAERHTLEQLSLDLGLERVTFTGAFAREGLTDLLADSFATAHTSIWAENSPFTVRESLTRGVPAIVSNRGGLPEMVDPGSGVVVDPYDPGALAESILGLHAARLAGTSAVRSSVERRAVSDAEHMGWLLDTYQGLTTRRN